MLNDIFLKVLVVFCCHIALSKELKRRSPGSDGLGSTFANFQGPSFFKIRDQEFSAYNSPKPAPASPVYNTPAPAPQYKPKPKGPTHDCSIQVSEWFDQRRRTFWIFEQLQYDKQTAQICLPKLGRPQCSPVTVKGVGATTAEKCLQITRTVCTQSEGECDMWSNIINGFVFCRRLLPYCTKGLCSKIAWCNNYCARSLVYMTSSSLVLCFDDLSDFRGDDCRVLQHQIHPNTHGGGGIIGGCDLWEGVHHHDGHRVSAPRVRVSWPVWPVRQEVQGDCPGDLLQPAQHCAQAWISDRHGPKPQPGVWPDDCQDTHGAVWGYHRGKVSTEFYCLYTKC